MSSVDSPQSSIDSVQISYEMSEDEKAVLSLLKDNSSMELNALKGQTGLSNKKWDKAITGLSQHKLAGWFL